jgi:hypothetical protein
MQERWITSDVVSSRIMAHYPTELEMIEAHRLQNYYFPNVNGRGMGSFLMYENQSEPRDAHGHLRSRWPSANVHEADIG